MSAIERGGGVKNWNWSKLPTDSTKELPTRERGCHKSGRNGRRCLWKVQLNQEGASGARPWLNSE